MGAAHRSRSSVRARAPTSTFGRGAQPALPTIRRRGRRARSAKAAIWSCAPHRARCTRCPRRSATRQIPPPKPMGSEPASPPSRASPHRRAAIDRTGPAPSGLRAGEPRADQSDRAQPAGLLRQHPQHEVPRRSRTSTTLGCGSARSTSPNSAGTAPRIRRPWRGVSELLRRHDSAAASRYNKTG